MAQRKNTTDSSEYLTQRKDKTENTEFRDNSAKLIFDNLMLCAQFLRGYVNKISEYKRVDSLGNLADRRTGKKG